MIELEVVGVRVEMPSNSPIVLLEDRAGSRYLPIWVGAVEATAIAYAQQGVTPPRPLTHDLMVDVLAAAGVVVSQVRITALEEGVFYAVVVLADGTQVSARPSDAIALAMRLGVPILGSPEVLDEAGIDIPDDEIDGATEPAKGPADEAAVREFREFLDQVSPEDFGA